MVAVLRPSCDVTIPPSPLKLAYSGSIVFCSQVCALALTTFSKTPSLVYVLATELRSFTNHLNEVLWVC